MTWEKWFSKAKVAIIAKGSIQVDKLLRLRPTSAELDYTQEPINEPTTSDETKAEKRQREQRNTKRKVDWQTQCQGIEDKGPYVDNIPRDEANTTIKSLLYLSLGQEATNIFHQRNPHTKMPKCTTDEFIQQLKDTFKEVRKKLLTDTSSSTVNRKQTSPWKNSTPESNKKQHYATGRN